jgi:hypothetical protein
VICIPAGSILIALAASVHCVPIRSSGCEKSSDRPGPVRSGIRTRSYFQLLSEPSEGANPEHPHGADASPHPPGDLLVGQPLHVAQQDDFGVIGGEPGQGVGQTKFQLMPAGALAR